MLPSRMQSTHSGGGDDSTGSRPSRWTHWPGRGAPLSSRATQGRLVFMEAIVAAVRALGAMSSGESRSSASPDPSAAGLSPCDGRVRIGTADCESALLTGADRVHPQA